LLIYNGVKKHCAKKAARDRLFQLAVADMMTRSRKAVPLKSNITDIDRVFRQNKTHSAIVVNESRHLPGDADFFCLTI